MNIQMVFTPSFLVSFSAEELPLIKRASEHHYDHKCIAATECGGFMYPWFNTMADANEPYPMTWSNLDILSKIIEARYSDLFTSDQIGILNNVWDRICAAHESISLPVRELKFQVA